MSLVISLYGAQQWRRSCGGLGVLTPSLSGSGVEMCTDPHFLVPCFYIRGLYS